MRTAARVFVGALAVVAAAARAGDTAPLDVHGLWRIDQAMREPILDRSHARIDFGADGHLGGHTSSNSMAASYTLDGTALRIGPIKLTTQARCSRLQLEQEDRILTALEHSVSARVRDDGIVELRDRDGRGMLRGTRFTEDR